MSERFGGAAARLCHAAVVLLGWRPGDFWDATPAELAMALMPPDAAPDSPDKATIDALRLQFPDN